jgi:hypothetical protein
MPPAHVRDVTAGPARQPASVYTNCCVLSSWFGQERIAAIDTSSEEALADSLSECREVVKFLELPEALQKELAAAMKESGMYVPEDDEDWARAYTALRGVWASKVRKEPQVSPTRSPTHPPPRAPPPSFPVLIRQSVAVQYPRHAVSAVDSDLNRRTAVGPSVGSRSTASFSSRSRRSHESTRRGRASGTLPPRSARSGWTDASAAGAASSPHSGRSARTSACAMWASTMRTYA